MGSCPTFSLVSILTGFRKDRKSINVMETYSPRLHVLLAREVDYAVVIRRGPSKHVCTVGWDMKTNEFALGQWLKGRIYERRSDLSPDGKYMIYFAMNGKWNSIAKGSWTAISKAPYLKAMCLWPKGDCWNGGGLFLSDTEYWINDRYCSVDDGPELDDTKNSTGLIRILERPSDKYFGNECPGIYYLRLLRDGWTLARRDSDAAYFEKRLSDCWSLRKTAHETTDHPAGKGCYYDEHELFNSAANTSIKFPEWEWADSKNDRLYWTENGILFQGEINCEGLSGIKELKNFNDMGFEPIEAPY